MIENKIILVADDARVIRTGELVVLLEGKSIRDLAKELGIAHSNIHRALKDAGYEPQTVWKQPEEVQS